MRRKKTIALTGGVCGGKSSALKIIAQNKEIQKLGWKVITIPEAATIVIPAGFSPEELLKEKTRENYCRFQNLVFNTQLFLEFGLRETAEWINNGPLLEVRDRGRPDIKCYNTEYEYNQLLKKHGITEIETRDADHDAVFHLSTIADTDPDLYLKLMKDNTARYEDTPERAIASDTRALLAWLGHPHQRIIPNKTLSGKILTFDEKLELLVRHILHVLADPPLEIEKKYFLYEPVDLAKFPVPFVKIDVEQIYLSAEIHKDRIRRRTQNGNSVYYRTHKEPTATTGVKSEDEYRISAKEYKFLSQFADPKRRVVKKERVHFPYKNQLFELDICESPEQIAGTGILEIELLDIDEPVETPPWLGTCDDVTGKKEFSWRNLAKK